MMIANVDPLLVLWEPYNGHTRLSDQIYNLTDDKFTGHILSSVSDLVDNHSDWLWIRHHRYNLTQLAQYF